MSNNDHPSDYAGNNSALIRLHEMVSACDAYNDTAHELVLLVIQYQQPEAQDHRTAAYLWSIWNDVTSPSFGEFWVQEANPWEYLRTEITEEEFCKLVNKETNRVDSLCRVCYPYGFDTCLCKLNPVVFVDAETGEPYDTFTQEYLLAIHQNQRPNDILSGVIKVSFKSYDQMGKELIDGVN